MQAKTTDICMYRPKKHHHLFSRSKALFYHYQTQHKKNCRLILQTPINTGRTTSPPLSKKLKKAQKSSTRNQECKNYMKIRLFSYRSLPICDDEDTQHNKHSSWNDRHMSIQAEEYLDILIMSYLWWLGNTTYQI